MKYLVFLVALTGIPPLIFLLHINRRWMKYMFWLMIIAMCLYISTSINFFSHEDYRGSARGMEVSFIHLLSFAVLGELLLRWKVREFLPEWGYRIYFIYFSLCLLSLMQSADLLISWFEIWKMIMLFFFYLAVYYYLRTTDDLKNLLGGLAAFVIINMVMVVKNHLEGAYQPHGVFPHQNCMAVAMHLFGAMFFAYYLTHGMKTSFGKLCTVGLVCSAAATLRSYSRVAIVLMVVTYGTTALVCLVRLLADVFAELPRYGHRHVVGGAHPCLPARPHGEASCEVYARLERLCAELALLVLDARSLGRESVSTTGASRSTFLMNTPSGPDARRIVARTSRTASSKRSICLSVRSAESRRFWACLPGSSGTGSPAFA